MKHVFGYCIHYNLYLKWTITHFVQVFFSNFKELFRNINCYNAIGNFVGIKHVPG